MKYKRKRTTFTNLEALFTFFSFSNNNIPCGYNEDVFRAASPAKLRSSDKCPSCCRGGKFASMHKIFLCRVMKMISTNFIVEN